MFGSVLFSRESAPRGHRAGAGDVFGCRGRERRRCCERRPEVLLSILQVPVTAPSQRATRVTKVEKLQFWSEGQ